MPISLGELATRVGCELIGDPGVIVDAVASLQSATPGSLSFLANPQFRSKLPLTRASAVILKPADVDACPTAAFVASDPYAVYARMAAHIYPERPLEPGIHPNADIAASATIAATAQVAAGVVVGEHTRIGDHVLLGPGSVVGPNCQVGNDCRFIANVTLVEDVAVGQRAILHPGVVIGSDGFGNAMTADGWVKVPQVGSVEIGDDVEIGANTTVDRGAIGATVIEDGVRIDNLCMIAHNARIGAHSALAAMTGIAGSAIIGKRCMFAGQSGSVGHVTICDDVIVGAQTFVSKNVTEPGTYMASFPASKAKTWARQLARFRRLDALMERVKKLEK